MHDKELNSSLENFDYKIAEFRKLQDFLIKAFSVLKAKIAAEKSLSELAAQTAHDIHSPIAAIQAANVRIKGPKY